MRSSLCEWWIYPVRRPLLAGVAVLCVFSGSVFGAAPAVSYAKQQQRLRARLLQAEMRYGPDPVRRLRGAARSRMWVQALQQYELLRCVGPAALDALASKPQGAAFLRRFLGDPRWLYMFLASGPLGSDPARDLDVLYRIWRRDPRCVSTRHEKTLAVAVALEYGRHGWPFERAWTRYVFYRDSRRQGRLHPIYDGLEAWEKRWLTGHGLSMHGGHASQVWLRDNVKLPAEGYRHACWQVAYRSYNCFGDSVQSWKYYFPFEGSFPSFTQMTRFVGGVCGRLSGYGAAAAVANGIPATTMGEPGHCAYAVRLARGKWTPAYSLSWKRSVHVNLYGRSWQMLVLTDRMMSEEPAWRRASIFRWQARLHMPACRFVPPFHYRVYRGSWNALPRFAALHPVASGETTALDYHAVTKARTRVGVVFTGNLAAEETGRYLLGTESDDGSRLFVDGKMVVDNDGVHGSRVRENIVELRRGEHRFRLEFFQNGGAEKLAVWSRAASGDAEAGAAYALAVHTQPINYPAWKEYAELLEAEPNTTNRQWREWHDGVLAGLAADFPEIAWSLVSRYAYPHLLPGLDANGKIALFLGFHRALKGWGAGRWAVESAFSKQCDLLGDGRVGFRFVRALIEVDRPSKTYLGPLLTWAFQKFGGNPRERAALFAAVNEVLTQKKPGGTNSAAVLDMASAALAAAEKSADFAAWNQVGAMIERAAPPLKAFHPEFPGELLSAGALPAFQSLSRRYDRPKWRHWFIGGRRPGFFHSNKADNPWVRLELPHFGEISGIVVVNRATHRERAVPLEISVSEDGKQWTRLAVFKKAKAVWRLDLRGRRVRARYVRAMKLGNGFLHLQNVRVYGRRLS